MKKRLLILFAGLMTVNSFAGVTAKETFDQGKVETKDAVARRDLLLVKNEDGQAMKVIDWPNQISFPSKTFNLDEGTIEFNVKFSIEPAKIMDKSWSMVRIYTGKAFTNGFFVIFGWKTGLMFITCDKNGQRYSLNYPQIRDWKADEWHHVAVSWKIKNPGESQLAMVIDYKPVASQSGLTIELDKDAWQKRTALEAKEKDLEQKSNEFWDSGGILLGYWGNPMAPEYLVFDDFTIYDTVVTFSEKKL